MTDRSVIRDQAEHARRTNPQPDDARLAEIRARHTRNRADGQWRTVAQSAVVSDVGWLLARVDQLNTERDAEAQRADAEGLTGAGIFSEYYDRWQGTVAEARRQAARVDEVAARGTAAIVAMGRDVRQARAERNRYRSAWQSARQRAEVAVAETVEDAGVARAIRRQRNTAEAAVARVREYCLLLADGSCRVAARETAQDVLRLLDGAKGAAASQAPAKEGAPSVAASAPGSVASLCTCGEGNATLHFSNCRALWVAPTPKES